jgi:hypothetical protein
LAENGKFKGIFWKLKIGYFLMNFGEYVDENISMGKKYG